MSGNVLLHLSGIGAPQVFSPSPTLPHSPRSLPCRNLAGPVTLREEKVRIMLCGNIPTLQPLPVPVHKVLEQEVVPVEAKAQLLQAPHPQGQLSAGRLPKTQRREIP